MNFKKRISSDKGNVSLGDLLWVIFGIGMLGLVVTFFFMVYVTLTIDSREYEAVKISEREIYSMKDGSSLSGTFIRGTGSIETGMNYNYYLKNEDGTASQGTVDAKKTKLVFINEGEKPKIEKYKKDFGQPYNFFLLGEEHIFYYIYVPEGSVVEDFVLDAE